VPELQTPPPFASLPTREGTCVNPDALRGRALRQTESCPSLYQAVSPCVRRRLRVISEKPDDGRHVRDSRLRSACLPVVDGRLRDPKLLGHFALPQPGCNTAVMANFRMDDRPLGGGARHKSTIRAASVFDDVASKPLPLATRRFNRDGTTVVGAAIAEGQRPLDHRPFFG
jgi:hypothetical protein